MTERIPVWIDTDAGVDDAAALLAAGRLPQLDIRGISAVAGNVELAHTFDNARKVCRLMDRDIPVYRGAEKPLLGELCTAPLIHGVDGLGGAELPPSEAPEEPLPAWDALYEAARAAGGALQVIAVGPLTNLATAFCKYPDLRTMLRRVLIMGGAARGGNVTPAAEFNFHADPHAAQMVFRSGVPIVLCGLDVTRKAYLTSGEVAEVGSRGTPVCRFFEESTRMALSFNERSPRPGLYLHDVCPVLYLTHPHLFQGEEAGVYVETRGKLTMGKTVTDLWSDRKFPRKNAFVVLDVDRKAFVSLVRSLLMSY
jgi:inosine-uridine nucleoside N-ribohydrolase